MITADPRQHLKTATDERCCRNCDAWAEDRSWDTMGDCLRVRWMLPVQTPATGGKSKRGKSDPEIRMVQQVTAPDHVCAKFQTNRSSIDAREEWALAAGLG